MERAGGDGAGAATPARPTRVHGQHFFPRQPENRTQCKNSLSDLPIARRFRCDVRDPNLKFHDYTDVIVDLNNETGYASLEAPTTLKTLQFKKRNIQVEMDKYSNWFVGDDVKVPNAFVDWRWEPTTTDRDSVTTLSDPKMPWSTIMTYRDLWEFKYFLENQLTLIKNCDTRVNNDTNIRMHRPMYEAYERILQWHRSNAASPSGLSTE